MRPIAILLGACLLASACTGSSEPEEASPSSVTTPDTTTSSTTKTVPETTTTTIPLPVAPFTGLPFEGDEAALLRPAVVVKVDNLTRARPQTGLDLADMVIELRVAGVTRFMAVYHSELPEPVGPVRSARTSDFDILTALNRPAFVYSGANTIVDQGLGQLDIYPRYEDDRWGFFRADNRNAPHNLYVNTPSIQAGLENGDPPQPWFQFGDEAEVAGQGRAIAGDVTVVFQETPLVRYRWDNEVNGWLRSQDGASHSTVSGDQLAPANVVILEARYGTSPADFSSPELISVGSGPAAVLTAGRLIEGTWSRTTNTEPPELSDQNGNPILLAPGRTWVEWPDKSPIYPES